MVKDLKGFTEKYLKLYESNDTVESDVCATFADECFELGIEMDCGKSFETESSINLTSENTDVNEIFSRIDDKDLLASAIFSRWRYITHWSYGESCLERDNREWFLAAFRRLFELTA